MNRSSKKFISPKNTKTNSVMHFRSSFRIQYSPLMKHQPICKRPIILLLLLACFVCVSSSSMLTFGEYILGTKQDAISQEQVISKQAHSWSKGEKLGNLNASTSHAEDRKKHPEGFRTEIEQTQRSSHAEDRKKRPEGFKTATEPIRTSSHAEDRRKQSEGSRTATEPIRTSSHAEDRRKQSEGSRTATEPIRTSSHAGEKQRRVPDGSVTSTRPKEPKQPKESNAVNYPSLPSELISEVKIGSNPIKEHK